MTDIPTPGPTPYGAPAGPTRTRTTRTVLIIVGAVLLVCCCGGIGVGGYLFNRVRQNVTAVTDAANSFFGALRGGDVGRAYGLLCSATRDTTPMIVFSAAQLLRPLRDYAVSGANVQTTNGVTRATVTVKLTFPASTETHVVPMAREDDAWHVCGNPY